MKELDLFKREKQWKIYHAFERKLKLRFLRSLSERKSIIIFGQLQNTFNLNKVSGVNISDNDKIRSLIRVHSMFCKVKI